MKLVAVLLLGLMGGCAALGTAMIAPATEAAVAGVKALGDLAESKINQVAQNAETKVRDAVRDAGEKLVLHGEEKGGSWGELLKTLGILLGGAAGAQVISSRALRTGVQLEPAELPNPPPKI
jgi:hypothetical protein